MDINIKEKDYLIKYAHTEIDVIILNIVKFFFILFFILNIEICKLGNYRVVEAIMPSETIACSTEHSIF